MPKSLLFLPLAVLGAVLLVSDVSPLLSVPVLLVGLLGALAFSAAEAMHDEERRTEATGTGAQAGNGRTPHDPEDPAQRP